MAPRKPPHYRPFSDTQLEYLRCNIFGHLWEDVTSHASRKVTYISGDHIVLRCTRCRTERRELWSIIGTLIYRSYTYPRGYRTTINSGQALTRREFARVELMARNPAPTRRKTKSTTNNKTSQGRRLA